MISYFKKSVNNVYKVSKKAVLKATNNSQPVNQCESLVILQQLIKSKKQILPTKKMGELATLSYSMVEFDAIYHRIFSDLSLSDDLKFLYFDPKSKKKTLRQRRNLLVVCGYLVKHGASGFIDEFRQQIVIFQNYASQEMLPMNEHYSFQIKSRAEYIVILLKSKSKLLKEKQLAMLIKQKMKLHQHASISIENNQNQSEIGNQSDQNSSENTSKIQKLQNFLQNYLFKYIYRVDEKLDELAQILAKQAEKYLLDQIPQRFQIDEIDEQIRMSTQTNLEKEQQIKKHQQALHKQEQFLNKKNKEISQQVNQRLIDI